MIIDIRSHFKKITYPNKFSRKEIEDQVKKVLSYLRQEDAARKVVISKSK